MNNTTHRGAIEAKHCFTKRDLIIFPNTDILCILLSVDICAEIIFFYKSSYFAKVMCIVWCKFNCFNK